MTTKRSFFERLSGAPATTDSFDAFDDELPVATPARKDAASRINLSANRSQSEHEQAGNEGQLPVDVNQTSNEIVIRAFVAGVRPDELNISINRDMVEISGSRMEREQVAGADYFTRELFWGSFSRTILLPQEVDVDTSTATAKDGLLTIVLPKLDKAKQTKLRVKVG